MIKRVMTVAGLAMGVACASGQMIGHGGASAEPRAGGLAGTPVVADAAVDAPGLVDVNAVLADATFSGVGEQMEMTITLPLPAWAARLGAVGRIMNYKGLCGPDGAVATPEQLLAHARHDLERMNAEANAPGVVRGSSVVEYGTSPKFRVTYDTQDINLLVLFLPSFQNAAEYVDAQLDNRTEIRIALSTADIPGNTIGTASSALCFLPWSTYVQGLRLADNRVPEDTSFAVNLPTGSMPVRYNASTTNTAETFVIVNDTQLRAIFGENALPQANAITIQLDNSADWDYFAFTDDSVDSGSLSLVDVAVHEITHGLGFRSQIREMGANPNTAMAGLDVARFRFPLNLVPPPGSQGSYPLTPAQFTTFPRHGGGPLVFDPNFYAWPNGPGISLIELESGDFGNGGFLQPSHLAFRADFEDKLGLMDPVLSSGETNGPAYWGGNETRPLTDMGWKLISSTDIIGDCNGNGLPDIVDIANGGRDADGDSRLDACEFFAPATSPAGLFVNTFTQTVYDANGISSLTQFVPGSATVLDRLRRDSVNLSFGSGSVDTVQEFEGKLRAPQADEYVFRVEHENDALLEIAGQTFFLPGEGTLQYADSFSVLSLPVPIQLEAGYHDFRLTVLLTETGPVRLVREARNLGGFQDIPATDMAGTFFEDCNGNNRDDAIEPDSDGDGIIDDCEEPDCDGDNIPDSQELDCDGNGVPDDCEPRGDVSLAFDVGVGGLSDQPIEIGTCGSPSGFQFDTEIALWDDAGNLLAFNDDDSSCNTIRLSRIVATLPEGDYVVGVAGFNVIFGEDFDAVFPNTASCSDSGAFRLKLGTQIVIDSVASGKVKYYRFTVDTGACSTADIASPLGEANIFDVIEFLSRWSTMDPRADFNNDGPINIFDIIDFLGVWSQGCP